MQFEPKSEEEAAGLFEAGVYDATVKSAKDTTSKSDNEMIALELTVFRDDGAEIDIKDWLVPIGRGLLKIRHFCESAGLIDLYEAGGLTSADCQGKSVFVRLKVENDDFGPQNKVVDYKGSPYEKPATTPAKRPEKASPKPGASTANRAAAEPIEDEADVPF